MSYLSNLHTYKTHRKKKKKAVELHPSHTRPDLHSQVLWGQMHKTLLRFLQSSSGSSLRLTTQRTFTPSTRWWEQAGSACNSWASWLREQILIHKKGEETKKTLPCCWNCCCSVCVKDGGLSLKGCSLWAASYMCSKVVLVAGFICASCRGPRPLSLRKAWDLFCLFRKRSLFQLICLRQSGTVRCR